MHGYGKGLSELMGWVGGFEDSQLFTGRSPRYKRDRPFAVGGSLVAQYR